VKLGQKTITPWVVFKLDLNFVLYSKISLVSMISKGIDTADEMSTQLGVYIDKVKKNLYWAMHLGLVEKMGRMKYKLTTFCRSILELDRLEKRLVALELLYYEICKNHQVISYIVNNLGYNRSFKQVPMITTSEIISALHKIRDELNASEDVINNQALKFLNSLAEIKGFGSLGIFKKAGIGKYIVEPHIPDWRAAAYILYDWWPYEDSSGRRVSRVKIHELFSKKNALGRIFFLDSERMNQLLAILERKNAIILETTAGLNQIAIDLSLTPGEILQRMISYEL